MAKRKPSRRKKQGRSGQKRAAEKRVSKVAIRKKKSSRRAIARKKPARTPIARPAKSPRLDRERRTLDEGTLRTPPSLTGGDNPSPDLEVVDDIGKALGVQYDDGEELRGSDKVKGKGKDRN